MIKKITLALLFVFLFSMAFYQGTRAYGSSFDILFNDSFLLAQVTVEAEKKEEEFLTKGDIILLLAASDYMKKKIQTLLSWTVGYDVTKISRARLVPTIKYVEAKPVKVPPDGRTVLQLVASVDDPGGLRNIETVRADLSSIGRIPNSILVDNGLWGDTTPNDGIYTLQTNVDPDIPKGTKEILIAVSNKKGWLALGRATLDVEKEPKILEAKATPEMIKTLEEEVVTFTVSVDNPGRIEDIEAVYINLKAIGEGTLQMRNDGREGDKKAGDNVFTWEAKVPRGISPGEKRLPIRVVNVIGGEANGEIILNVVE